LNGKAKKTGDLTGDDDLASELAEGTENLMDQAMKSLSELRHFIQFYLLEIPISVLIVSAILGAILAGLEDWTFLEGFYYIASLACHLTHPLNEDDPGSTLGRAFVIIISAWAVCFIGVLIDKALHVDWPRAFVHKFEKLLGATGGGNTPKAGEDCVEAPEEQSGSLWRHFLAYFIISWVVVPIALFVVCVTFGAVLAWAEEWSFWTGVRYILMNVAHLPPPRPLTDVEPESVGGAIIDIVIALFVLSLTIYAYTLACWPVIVDQTADALNDFSLKIPSPFLAFFFIVFILMTACFLLFVAIIGPILAVCEGWDIHQGIVYTAALVSQQALTDARPDSVIGALLCGLVGMWALALLGTAIGLMATLEFPEICARGVELLSLRVLKLFHANEFETGGILLNMFLFAFFLVPILGASFGLIFGGMLSLVEGWTLEDGFLYIVTNVLILPGPLTEVLPDTYAGIWFSLVISIWGLLVIVSVFVVVTLFDRESTYPAKTDDKEADLDA